MPELTPPDPKRCQAEAIEYRPFVMGGSVWQSERCESKPHWLVTEIVPDKDGLMGSMTMCDEHAAIFIEKKQLPPENYTMEPIIENL